MSDVTPTAQLGQDAMRTPIVRCALCPREGEHLCRACARNLALGLPPLRTRELGALRLVREVRP